MTATTTIIEVFYQGDSGTEFPIKDTSSVDHEIRGYRMTCHEHQVKKAFDMKDTSTAIKAMKTGMCENTVRKYMGIGKLPSELKKVRTWKTRENPFDEIWDYIVEIYLTPGGGESYSGFEIPRADTIFEDLCETFPGRFKEGQLRSLQRKIKQWRALEGPNKEIFFTQQHHPGERCQSDFSCMNELKVTIGGQPFKHMIYHFVLTYSNWEAANICFSENLESLYDGFQRALWKLGAVPKSHQSDQLSAAVNNHSPQKDFTDRYKALLSHYKIEGKKIQVRCPNENGDVEQSHYRIKDKIHQKLLLRGSKEFSSLDAYQKFVEKVISKRNKGRKEKLEEELAVMSRLPERKLDAFTRSKARVSTGSTVRINHNTYSVPSRLIGENIEVHLHAFYLEIWFAQRLIEIIPRLKSHNGHHIQYRHVIHWLVRKPGAFENYRYREDLYPSSVFRMTLDLLENEFPKTGHKEYLKILVLASDISEEKVEDILRVLNRSDEPISFDLVKAHLESLEENILPCDVDISAVELQSYDGLFVEEDV